MAEPTLVTREELASALDVKASAYLSATLDRKCASATSNVLGILNRRSLHPVLKTRYIDFPNTQNAGPWRVYFDDDTLLSLTTLTSGGIVIPSSAYNLEPNHQGPPYTYLELIRSGSYSFFGLQTPQHAISFLGYWGFSTDEAQPGVISAAVVSTTATTITVNTPVGGVGSLIRIDTERMVITDKAWSVSGHTVGNGAGLLASTTDAALTIADTSTYLAGETLLIDTERVSVREVVDGTTLTIARAYDGSTLAAHANGTAIKRQLTLTVFRGAAGTTAATHLISAPVYRWLPPASAAELALAYAEDALLQGNSGYARTVGSGDNERQASGAGIKTLEQRVIQAMGRKARRRAV